MRFWRPRCPVRPVEQQWIDESLRWLVAEFGPEPLHAELILPTDDFFPGVYTGSRADVRRVLELICAHMAVDPHRVELEHYSAGGFEPGLAAVVPLSTASDAPAGHHRVRDGRSIIGVKDELARRPMALVATIAHELGHARLLGEGRISARRRDHEPLTDLLTVFFGLGVFSANAAFEYGRSWEGQYAYSATSRLGYLTVPMFGYALARYAWLRGEPDPPWARHLRTNPRAFLRQGLRHLRAGADHDAGRGRDARFG